jgi:hypothetical protein
MLKEENYYIERIVFIYVFFSSSEHIVGRGELLWSHVVSCMLLSIFLISPSTISPEHCDRFSNDS